jgi:hypothetical protein
MAKGRTIKTVAVTLFIIMLLIGMVMALAISNNIRDAGADLGLIDLKIDGNYANLSVGLDIKPKIDEKDITMNIENGESDIPLQYDGDSINGQLTRKEFTELIENDIIDITGDVDVKVLGPVKVNRDLKQEVNISFIRELSSSMEVANLSVNFYLFYTVIEFDITANVSRDFQINITDTEATVISPGGTFNSRILELNYRTARTGNARVSLPLLGALGLALNSRNVMIESWGISVMVDIPLFNG